MPPMRARTAGPKVADLPPRGAGDAARTCRNGHRFAGESQTRTPHQCPHGKSDIAGQQGNIPLPLRRRGRRSCYVQRISGHQCPSNVKQCHEGPLRKVRRPTQVRSVRRLTPPPEWTYCSRRRWSQPRSAGSGWHRKSHSRAVRERSFRIVDRADYCLALDLAATDPQRILTVRGWAPARWCVRRQQLDTLHAPCREARASQTVSYP